MRVKSLIACSAMVLAFGVGSAIAGDTVEKTTIVPQPLKLLSEGVLVNVAPMTAAQLEAVRGTWWPVQAHAAAIVTVVHAGNVLGLGGNPPPGQQKK